MIESENNDALEMFLLADNGDEKFSYEEDFEEKKIGEYSQDFAVENQENDDEEEDEDEDKFVSSLRDFSVEKKPLEIENNDTTDLEPKQFTSKNVTPNHESIQHSSDIDFKFNTSPTLQYLRTSPVQYIGKTRGLWHPRDKKSSSNNEHQLQILRQRVKEAQDIMKDADSSLRDRLTVAMEKELERIKQKHLEEVSSLYSIIDWMIFNIFIYTIIIIMSL